MTKTARYGASETRRLLKRKIMAVFRKYRKNSTYWTPPDNARRELLAYVDKMAARSKKKAGGL